jgi:hypothetical protein
LKTITGQSNSFVLKKPNGSGKGKVFSLLLFYWFINLSLILLTDFIRKCQSIDDYKRSLIESMKSGIVNLLIEEFYDLNKI